MSRHLLLDRPDVRIVIGFDHPLQSLFGQVFTPRDGRIAVDGWPTRSGLGTRRPIETTDELHGELNRLIWWVTWHPHFPTDIGEAVDHLLSVIKLLRREWDEGEDLPELPLPACLQEAR